MGRTIHEIMDEFMKQVVLVRQKMQYTMLEDILYGSHKAETKSFASSIKDIRIRKFGMKIELPAVIENNCALELSSNAVGKTNCTEVTVGRRPPDVEGTSTVTSDPAIINKETAAEEISNNLYMINKPNYDTTVYTVTKDEITFNGNPMSDVISYDEKAGEVHYYERHWSTGDLIPDGTDSTGHRTAKSKGTVKVIKKYKEDKPFYPDETGGPLDRDQGPYDDVGGWYPCGTAGRSPQSLGTSFQGRSGFSLEEK